MAGTPIVLGPGFFFMIREQSDPFVADAALGSLHAMLATLMFCLSYVLLAKRLGAFASVACSALIWLLAAAIADQLPGGVFFALALFGATLLFSRVYINSIGLSSKTVSAPVRWVDLLIRGVLAGGVVCLATILLVNVDPAVSGIVLSFPIGMLTIALTLHQRYGVEVARVTLANTQLGMLSLVAFSAVLSASVELFPSSFAFWLSLFLSLFVSTFLWLFSRWGDSGKVVCKS
ncbi:Amidase [Halomonas sp. R57-5]|nr:Amidase [Halomonas sp. R57-5]